MSTLKVPGAQLYYEVSIRDCLLLPLYHPITVLTCHRHDQLCYNSANE